MYGPDRRFGTRVDYVETRRISPVLLAGALLALAACAWLGWSALTAAADAIAPTRTASPAEQRQQEILRANAGQPGDPSLGQAYRELNARHFSGRLPDIPVRYEPRLDEVGALAGHVFTLKGMFGRVGSKTMILLHPELAGDAGARAGTLSHEMVHAYLFMTGDSGSDHGPAFQAVLERLADEGAFPGVLASAVERDGLRAWLDAESARLDAESAAMTALGQEIDRERQELEHALAGHAARVAAANAAGHGWPTADETAALDARRIAYNDRAGLANDRAARDRNAVAAFNRQVDRYNQMITYPDGLAASSELVKARTVRH